MDLAGDLSLAFVNTAGARKNNRQLGVGSYAELLTWGLRAGVISPSTAELAGRRAAARVPEAAATFAAAAELRSALSRAFSAIATDTGTTAADLAVFSNAWAATMPALRLIPGEHGPTWAWAGAEDALDQVLWPVLMPAAELLTATEDRPKISRCAAASCPLLFAERYPARHRRWCEMKTCGARAKALRYYHRTGKKNRPKNWRYP